MINQVSEMDCAGEDSQTDDSDAEPGFIKKIDEVNAVRGHKIPLLKIKTSGYNVVWQPDTGASRDIWSAKHVEQYENDTGVKVHLQPSDVRLFAYGQDQN